MSARTGWAWPANAGKPHYFDERGRSLCGHAKYYGALTDGRGTDGDCRNCLRLLGRVEPAGVWYSTPRSVTFTPATEVRH